MTQDNKSGKHDVQYCEKLEWSPLAASDLLEQPVQQQRPEAGTGMMVTTTSSIAAQRVTSAKADQPGTLSAIDHQETRKTLRHSAYPNLL